MSGGTRAAPRIADPRPLKGLFISAPCLASELALIMQDHTPPRSPGTAASAQFLIQKLVKGFLSFFCFFLSLIKLFPQTTLAG